MWSRPKTRTKISERGHPIKGSMVLNRNLYGRFCFSSPIYIWVLLLVGCTLSTLSYTFTGVLPEFFNLIIQIEFLFDSIHSWFFFSISSCFKLKTMYHRGHNRFVCVAVRSREQKIWVQPLIVIVPTIGGCSGGVPFLQTMDGNCLSNIAVNKLDIDVSSSIHSSPLCLNWKGYGEAYW